MDVIVSIKYVTTSLVNLNEIKANFNCVVILNEHQFYK